ncbi:MAG: Rrf2 family transcriptional regulator [Spirochaetaceae bacterium]|jgi:Rrf2 family protein|nr:Rrf2 family transcriptional regulator [Spirochaetaceae bacterium]
MRISTKGRYSLEALLHIALLPPGDLASTRAIAEATSISEGYLEQLFIPLRKAGIVQGIRGPLGGYLLNREPEEIRVGDILRIVEGPLELVECVNSEVCPKEAGCMSKHTWSELYQEISRCVDSITLMDLVSAYHAMDQPEYVI